MRHVKSNLNILKLNNKINLCIKSKSKRNFKKSSSTLHINGPNLNTKSKSYNLLTKKEYKSSIIPTKYFNNYKGKNNQYKIYFLNGKCKAYKNNYSSQAIFNNNSNNTRSISIRLNFKNKIINNYFMKRYKINNSKNNIKNKLKATNNNLNQKIKEKDKQITLLQKDLLQSQKLLSQLQAEKQKEISSKYMTIKYEDSLINNNGINSTGHRRITKYSSLVDFFDRNSENNLRINMLKTNYLRRKKLSFNKSMPSSKKNIFSNRRKNKSKNNQIKKNLNIIISPSSINKFHLFNNTSQNINKNCKTRNIKHKNFQKDNFHYGAISNTKRKNKKNSSPIFIRFSSSPSKLFPQFIHQYNCKPKTIKNSLKKKGSSNDFKKNYNNSKDSPYNTQITINYTSIKNKSNKNNSDNICSKSEEFIDMMNKGEDMIERTKSILRYLIILNDKIKELKEKK